MQRRSFEEDASSGQRSMEQAEKSRKEAPSIPHGIVCDLKSTG
jgi:hypothetical protein